MAEQIRNVQTTNVADLLERILDKGVVIVGDIRINLVDVELLTIKIRLLIASVDKAKPSVLIGGKGIHFSLPLRIAHSLRQKVNRKL